MNIIDAHHHIWIPEQTKPDLGYRWLREIGSIKPFGDPTEIQRDYTWTEYIAESERYNVVGSVYLQCDGSLPDPVAETAWVQSEVTRSPDQFAIVGYANLASSKAQKHIEEQCKFESFKGVRQIISYLPEKPKLCFSTEHLLRNVRWRDQFALLAENRLSFDLQLYPEQMFEAAEFFSLFPNVPVVIDHAGSPYDQSKVGKELWQKGVQKLSELENISIKLSGFGMCDANWNAESIKPVVYTLLDSFGPERIMYGSNFPVDKLMATFDDTVDRIVESIKSAGPSALTAVFESTARQFYKLSIIED